MGRAALPLLSLLFLFGSAACERTPSGKQESKVVPKATAAPAVSTRTLPPRIAGGSPEPPRRLPPGQSCQEALGNGRDVDSLPGQVNGALVRGAAGLRQLRARWGDALIIVRGGNFERSDLRGADLHNICFVESKFAASDWRGAHARGVGFLWSDLTGAMLRGASMPHILFYGPFLKRADASGVDFSGGRITGNDFGGWDGLRLDGADLRDFRFDCAPVSGERCAGDWGKVSFRRADLRGAWIDTYWGDADWTGARLAETQVNVGELPNLGRARLSGSLLVYQRPARARLSASGYGWLRRHIGKRGEILPIESDRRRVTRPAAWMRPGAEALFMAPVIDFDPAARRSAIFRRLLPAIVAGAISYVRVKVDRGGKVSASGSAVGGNAHMCSLGAKNLRFGPGGWYSGIAELFDRADKRPMKAVPVLRFRGDRAEVYERGHPDDEAILRNRFDFFVMCGARAGFEEMIRVPLPPGGAHRLWYEAGMDARQDGDP